MLVNALPAITGLITAPLQARALGVEGRGTLAAIVVPLSVAPILLNFGIMQFAGKEAARGRRLGPLIGSLGAVYLGIGACALLLAVPTAGFFAEGRETVEVFLIIGFCLLPIILQGQLLLAVNSGLQRWRWVIGAQLIPALTTLIGIVTLYVLGELTVTSAATLVIVGALGAIVPLVSVLKRAMPLEIDSALVREGVPFGLKAWLGTVASYANVRLDQLLMIRWVSARELGLYVVAATIASASGIVAAAVAGASNPRIARGDRVFAARALRVALAAVTLLHLFLAALTPWLLDVLFGEEFGDATSMAWILLVGGVPLAGATILANALISAGRPALSAWGEVIALSITIPGLALLLPRYGGDGAAIVSLAAYSANFVFLLLRSRRIFQCPLSWFLLPRPGDVRWTMRLLKFRRGGTERSA
jgi:O-antigen/teichoic acid export membrane protein